MKANQKAKLGDKEGKVLAALYNFKEGARPFELCKDKSLADEKPQAIRVFLQRLVEKGMVEQSSVYGVTIYRARKPRQQVYKAMLQKVIAMWQKDDSDLLVDMMGFGLISPEDVERRATELQAGPEKHQNKEE